jgi:hypothetical protein
MTQTQKFRKYFGKDIPKTTYWWFKGVFCSMTERKGKMNKHEREMFENMPSFQPDEDGIIRVPLDMTTGTLTVIR